MTATEQRIAELKLHISFLERLQDFTGLSIEDEIEYDRLIEELRELGNQYVETHR